MAGLKQRVGAALHHHWTEAAIMLLVLCDVVLVMVEAGIDGHILCIGGRVVSHSGFVKQQPPMGIPMGMAYHHLSDSELLQRRSVAGSGGHRAMHSTGASYIGPDDSNAEPVYGVPSGNHPWQALQCNTRTGHEAEHLMHTCHSFSIAILCIFMVELLLKLWATPEEFRESFCHRLDLFVVTVSLVLDTVVMAYIESWKETEAVEIVTALLILSRSWRIVRIFHGFYEEYSILGEEAERPREENKKLRSALQRVGIDPDAELAREEGASGAEEKA